MYQYENILVPIYDALRAFVLEYSGELVWTCRTLLEGNHEYHTFPDLRFSYLLALLSDDFGIVCLPLGRREPFVFYPYAPVCDLEGFTLCYLR